MQSIIVPLRCQPEFDRYAHLAALQTALAAGLTQPTCLVVVEEEMPSPHRFNRGALLNLGFQLAPPSHTVLFHDVDLLPCAQLLREYNRSTPAGMVRHLGRRWDRYASNPQYLGGVVALHPQDFRDFNGFPSTVWGWGGEDDALAVRCHRAGLQIVRPEMGVYVDQEALALSAKLALLRRTDAKCGDKWEQLAAERRGEPRPGLAEVRGEVRSCDKTTLSPTLQQVHYVVRIRSGVEGAA
jgi:hypothetical protein